MYQRFPEHPRLQLRGCSHRDLPQRGIKETPDDRPGIRRSDGFDLPRNDVLKTALRHRCRRCTLNGIRHLSDRLCAGGGEEEKIRDELLIRIQKYLQGSFSAVLFFRAKMKIVAGDRAQRENVPRHIRSSPHCLPGLTSSSRKCPVPVCQCFLSRIFTAIEKQPPSCTLHARKKAAVLLFRIYFRYPVAKSTTFRYGVPFAHAARFSPAILTIRSNVSGRKKFPAT